MTLLDHIRQHSGIVADSSDLAKIQQYTPLSGVTTNPTLILQGMERNSFPDLVYEAVNRAQSQGGDHDVCELTQDWLLVLVADRLSQHVTGRVSIEVDARLAYNIDATCARASRIMTLADSIDLGSDQLLIKLASTWEGIQSAKYLELHGICCNMTLLFDFYQAVACAQAQATLISPFVGRIYDWYKAQRQVASIAPDDDPGIESVKRIHSYYRHHNIDTLIMAASFRTTEQIEHLTGCDLLTISPTLLDQLSQERRQVEGSIENYQPAEEFSFHTKIDQNSFDQKLSDNPMASEKLVGGINQFIQDQEKLEQQLTLMLSK